MAATTDEARSHFAELLRVARAGAAGLGDGWVKAALSEEFFSQIEARLSGELSGWSTWPPLLLFAARSETRQLAALDDAMKAVAERTRPDRQVGIGLWLTAGADDAGARSWRCGFFELAMKTRFLAGLTDVEFDVVLPNGRDADIRATVAGRTMLFEATVITESDEDQDVWSKFMAAKAADANAVLVRPGDHDSAHSRGPSPYYDCARVYTKVYDKLAKNWDPAKSQLSDVHPNVILLSVWTGHGNPSVLSPGVGWALDELLADQPNAGAGMTGVGLTDISLATFLRRRAPSAALELLQSPRRVGAIVTLSQTALNRARVNSNANPRNRISHAELAAIETAAALPLDWA